MLDKELQPMEKFTLEKFLESCVLWEGLHAGVGEECEGSCPEEAGAAACDELTATSIPIPL